MPSGWYKFTDKQGNQRVLYVDRGMTEHGSVHLLVSMGHFMEEVVVVPHLEMLKLQKDIADMRELTRKIDDLNKLKTSGIYA